MTPKPSIRNFRRAHMKVCLICAYCKSRALDGDAYCRECGHGLIRPSDEACLSCGRTDLGEGKHCPACGAYRLRRAPKAPPRRTAARIGVMAGLGALLAVAISMIPGSVEGGPSRLGGVTVGDGPTEVEQALGHPEERGTEVFWQGADGKSHHMIQWQYGMDETQIADLTITFIDGKVHQVGALAGSWQTSEGLRIGDRLPKAERIYGTAIEDAPIEGLVPRRFIRGPVVVRVITEAPSDEILAIGVESPKQAPLDAAEVPESDPHQHVPPVTEDEPLLPRQRYY